MSESVQLASLRGEFASLKGRLDKLERVVRQIQSSGDPEIYLSYNGVVATGYSGLFWRRAPGRLVEVDLIYRVAAVSGDTEVTVTLNGTDMVIATLPATLDRVRIPCSIEVIPNQDLVGVVITASGGGTDLTMILRFDS